jgi:transcription-repair coupling factor (superfamily II helicase)
MKTIREIKNERLAGVLAEGRDTVLAAVPDGMTGLALADLIRASGRKRLLFVARDGQRSAEVERAVRFFAPDIEVLDFPAWDCLPYDRVSPHPSIVAKRMATLARLAEPIRTGRRSC